MTYGSKEALFQGQIPAVGCHTFLAGIFTTYQYQRHSIRHNTPKPVVIDNSYRDSGELNVLISQVVVRETIIVRLRLATSVVAGHESSRIDTFYRDLAGLLLHP